MRFVYIFILLFVSFDGRLAFADKQQVCSAILDFGVHNEQDTFSADQISLQTRSLLCGSTFTEYSAAEAAGIDLGINIIDVIDGSLGGSTDQSTYKSRRSEFCRRTSYSGASNSSAFASIRSVSADITRAWSECVRSSQSFHAWIVPGRNPKAFSIGIRNGAGGTFNIQNINISPSGAADCGVYSNASGGDIEIKTKDLNIACEKSTDETIQVSMNTDKGGLRPTDVVGEDDLLSDLRDRLSNIEAGGGLAPTGTVVYIDRARCPLGWIEENRLNGRYVVGLVPDGQLGLVVGQALTNGENRATGKHSHTHKAPWDYGAGAGSHPRAKADSSGTTSEAGDVEGTNAPYIQLKACRRL